MRGPHKGEFSQRRTGSAAQAEPASAPAFVLWLRQPQSPENGGIEIGVRRQLRIAAGGQTGCHQHGRHVRQRFVGRDRVEQNSVLPKAFSMIARHDQNAGSHAPARVQAPDHDVNSLVDGCHARQVLAVGGDQSARQWRGQGLGRVGSVRIA